MKTPFLYMLLIALLVGNLQAQTAGTITVKVVDHVNQKPIGSVDIIVYRHGNMVDRSKTDTKEGQCKFSNLTAGKYKIRADRWGYLRKEQVVELAAGQNKIVTLKLEFENVEHQEWLEKEALTKALEKEEEATKLKPRKSAEVPVKRELMKEMERFEEIEEIEVEELVEEEIEAVDAIIEPVGATPNAFPEPEPEPEPEIFGGGEDLNRKMEVMKKMDAEKSVERPMNEDYAALKENEYKAVQDEPLSTFSIDVDRASYSNVRRFLNNMQRPPKNAIRIEEMINYFDYQYPQPTGEHPFEVITEASDCPWNKEAKLVHIGLQGKNIDLEKAPANNLVFLLDVSGSMNYGNKLPLLKESLKLLINNMRPKDRIAIAVYAGAAGLVLPSTNDKNKIIAALDNLSAGGSTAGGEGIQLAYKVAKEQFVKDGNNRVILATDGDFNVGVSSNGDLETLITEKRNDNIFLTVLGFGTGNYKDSKMEVLADKGNGNYAYIDNIREAKKTLVKEMGGTLYTIAKDVKIQIEFNPAEVKSYRLVGYENRLLKKEDFNDDTKDAGELGAGHTVTALYEIVLTDGYKASKEAKKVDDLKYQKTHKTAQAVNSKELMTVKLRYKQPKGTESVLLEHPLKKELKPLAEASENFRFAASVAGFGMLLRESKFKQDLTYKQVLELAKGAKGTDKEGYREEFIGMVRNVDSMMQHANK